MPGAELVMEITQRELMELLALHAKWDGISTEEGITGYQRILGLDRTQQILDAAGKHQKIELKIKTP
jgi:hypothetical protein